MSALCQMMQEKIKGQSISLFKVEEILLLHVCVTPRTSLGCSSVEMRFFISFLFDTDIC